MKTENMIATLSKEAGVDADQAKKVLMAVGFDEAFVGRLEESNIRLSQLQAMLRAAGELAM